MNNSIKIMAIKRARLEVCHATAILRTYLHDPDAQGILQLLTIAIDDADKVIAKLQHGVIDPCQETATTGAKTSATKKTPLKMTPPSTLTQT